MIFVIIAGVLLILNAIFLIIIVLLQKPKDEDSSFISGGSTMRQVVSVEEVPHILYRVTYFSIAAQVGLSLLLSYLLSVHFSIEEVLS